jgi:hypothetical protein
MSGVCTSSPYLRFRVRETADRNQPFKQKRANTADFGTHKVYAHTTCESLVVRAYVSVVRQVHANLCTRARVCVTRSSQLWHTRKLNAYAEHQINQSGFQK